MKKILVLAIAASLCVSMAQAISCPKVPAKSKNGAILSGEEGTKWVLLLTSIREEIEEVKHEITWEEAKPLIIRDTEHLYRYTESIPQCEYSKYDKNGRQVYYIRLYLQNPVHTSYICEHDAENHSYAGCKTNSFIHDARGDVN
ncbi:MAG TPA: hypothetical protein VKR58_07335 [Aquella sp.]|nr:hypothetical protein [Aquella sp.]